MRNKTTSQIVRMKINLKPKIIQKKSNSRNQRKRNQKRLRRRRKKPSKTKPQQMIWSFQIQLQEKEIVAIRMGVVEEMIST